jgi:hypothetical protein
MTPASEISFGAVSLNFAVFLALGIFVLQLIGRRLGRHRLAADPDGSHAGATAVEGAVFALLGLLVAFTFSGAAARFDARRALIVEETNAIGTAWLRVDLLPADVQPGMRDAFRRYLDARLEVYRQADISGSLAVDARARAIQREIWDTAVTSAIGVAGPAPMLVLPALNAMFDIAETRVAVPFHHPPVIIFVMLGVLALVGALLLGYEMARSRQVSVVHTLGFAVVMGMVVFVTLDIEFPRRGFVRLDAADQILVNLRASMN